MIVKKIETNEELQLAFQIRQEVFVLEQGVAVEIELDEYDSICDHVLITDNHKPIATGRMRNLDGKAKLQRICVSREYRGTGIGKLVIQKLEELAQEQKLVSAILNAQYHAKEFYEKLGYEVISDLFTEQNIEHVTMIKKL